MKRIKYLVIAIFMILLMSTDVFANSTILYENDNVYSVEFITTTLINLVITALGYCTLPVILRIKNGKYEYEKGHKIVLINCIAVWLIFMIIKISQGNNSVSGAVFLYYLIDRVILLNPQKQNKKNTEIISENKNIKKENTEKEKKNIIFYVAITILVLIIIILSIGIYVFNIKSDYESEIKNLNDQITTLKNYNSKLNQEKINDLGEKIDYAMKVEFLDENIVFVLDGYGNYYYTYDQMMQVTQGIECSYWAYNKEQAIDLGYKAWKK